MTMTPNLDLPLIAPGQTNKHITANECFTALEKTVTEQYTAALASIADHVLPYVATEGADKSGLQVVRYKFTGTPGGAVNVIHPNKKHLAFIHNATNQNIVFKTLAGTGPTIAAGAHRLVYCDGTNIDEIGVSAVVPSLNSITDVDVVTPADGTLLYYDLPLAKWKALTLLHGQILVWNGAKMEARQPYERKIEPATAIAPILTDSGKLIHCTAVTAIAVTLPGDATLDFPDNARLSYLQKAAGQITFVAGVGATVLKPSIFNAKSHSVNSIAHAIKTGDNEWTLSGGLELVP